MALYNRECLHCGAKYYVCKYCVGINSWKNVCCSVECYREMLKEQQQKEEEEKIYDFKPKEVNKGEIKDMYVILKNSADELEVSGYDLDLGRFDTTDGQTHTDEDIDYIKISLEELQDIHKE